MCTLLYIITGLSIMENVVVVETFIYYAGCKCDFIFWFKRNKHCTKNIHSHLLGINWYLLETIEPS